jgi:hypothetical protein
MTKEVCSPISRKGAKPMQPLSPGARSNPDHPQRRDDAAPVTPPPETLRSRAALTVKPT